VDTVESALFTRARSKPERFLRLQEHLLKFYPPDHGVISLYSATFPILVPIRDTFPLRDLPTRYLKGTQSGTLYIPPILKDAVRDKALEEQLYNREHLAKITAQERNVTNLD
jgi:hypothetical protein